MVLVGTSVRWVSSPIRMCPCYRLTFQPTGTCTVPGDDRLLRARDEGRLVGGGDGDHEGSFPPGGLRSGRAGQDTRSWPLASSSSAWPGTSATSPTRGSTCHRSLGQGCCSSGRRRVWPPSSPPAPSPSFSPSWRER